MAAVFQFFRFRFHFRALDPVRFPAAKAGNTIRGALGLALRQAAAPALFSELFRPRPTPGMAPSGLADPPRSLVIRASHLDGYSEFPGASFSVDLHVFDTLRPLLGVLRQAFECLALDGIGPGRGRAALERVEQLNLEDAAQEIEATPAAPPLALDLKAIPLAPVDSIRVRFATPTELKGDGMLAERPEFPILFARLRDRIAALSSLYGQAPLAVDFGGLGERARAVRLTHSSLAWQRTPRRSSRTGQVHYLGGFTGDADYAGPLGEFLPWLQAARWVGVGRHTVWGQGEVRVIAAGPP